MTFVLAAQVLVLLVALPALLVVSLVLARDRSRALYATKAGLAAAYVLALLLVGGWHVLGVWLRWVWAGLVLGAILVGWRRVRDRPAWVGGRPAAIRVGLQVAGVMGLTIYALAMLLGRLPPGEPVELELPLGEGVWYVGSGGTGQVVNGHAKVRADPGLSDWRGQAFGIDVVGLDRWGRRADGLYPPDPSAYVVFGAPVRAPCDGTVLRVENGLPDLRPPERDVRNKAGNYVFLQCPGARVLLAHLMEGSVRVRPGEQVAAGAPLGKVGNSGNTTEPHLHVHAQRGGGDGEVFLDGEPLPLTFDGDYPVTGEVLVR